MCSRMDFSTPRYLIADDFTGANDVGVALATRELNTNVLMPNAEKHNKSNQNQVQIICTDSRDYEVCVAKDIISTTCKHYDLVNTQPHLIKKVDSTLRGNVGSEIEALLDVGYQLAVIAIAAPFAQRKTHNGCCYVKDIPLAQTEFATDPKSPIQSSRIKDILQSQTTVSIAEYLQDNQNKSDHKQQLKQYLALGNKIVVCDAESLEDLSALYTAAFSLKIPVIFVTTGEITNAINFTDKNKSENLPPVSASPILGLIGSMSQVTQSQVEHLIEHCHAVDITLDLDRLFTQSDSSYLNHIASAACEVINSNRHCIVRSCNDSSLRYQLNTIADRYKLSQTELAETVRDSLTHILQLILFTPEQPKHIGGLILCGGDIAIATARALNVSSFSIKGLVSGCVPWGTFELNETPFPIFTKAGGFGDPTTFTQLAQLINKEVI